MAALCCKNKTKHFESPPISINAYKINFYYMFRTQLKHLLATIIYYSGFIKILRLFGRNYAKILIYHSVNDLESDFIKGTKAWTSVAKFKKHLQYISRSYHIVSLKKLVTLIRRKRLPKNTVVITFDDGFSDNYYSAYPILKHYKIAATIFLVTDCVEEKRPIWIQELYYLINRVGVNSIVEVLNNFRDDLEIPQFKFESNNHSRRNISMEKSLENYLAFTVKKDLRNKIIDELYLSFKMQQREIFYENDIFLDWDKVKQMRKEGIDFGNHSASHTPLSVLSLKEQEKEIQQSKNIIENKLGKDFIPFAYPFGMGKYFTSDTQKIVIDSGHSCIVTAKPTLNSESTSPFDLGRIDIKNISVPVLAFEMEKGILKKILEKFIGGTK